MNSTRQTLESGYGSILPIKPLQTNSTSTHIPGQAALTL